MKRDIDLLNEAYNKVRKQTQLNEQSYNSDMDKKKPLADQIEHVMDLFNAGFITDSEDALDYFKGYNINMKLLKSILDEEFEEGYSDRWEKLTNSIK